MTNDQTAKQRLRLTFAKGEAVKYISHLDLARTWERVFRRVGLPLAYSQGYNPRPRFQIAAALPVGVTGGVELLDAWLVEPWFAEEAFSQLHPALPQGLDVSHVAEVELGSPSLQSQMRAADYRAVVRSPEPVEAIATRVELLLEAPTLPRRREHKGKLQTYDLRPLIQTLAVGPGPQGVCILTMRLQASPQGAGRPDQVLDALGLTLAVRSIERTALHFASDLSAGDGG